MIIFEKRSHPLQRKDFPQQRNNHVRMGILWSVLL